MAVQVDSATPFTAPAPVPAVAESMLERVERIFRDGPRPEDYLVVPAWIQDWVDAEMRRYLVEHDLVVTPEAKQRILADNTLHDYYAGKVVITLRTPDGVVALAVGDDEVTQYLDQPGHKPFPGVRMENP